MNQKTQKWMKAIIFIIVFSVLTTCSVFYFAILRSLYNHADTMIYLHMLLTMILIVLRPVIEILFAKSYHQAVEPAPILVLCIAVHAVAGNLGALYTVFKVTKGALFTSSVGAVVNIALNLIFIPRFGMVGAALTTIIGYIVTLILRWFDIRRYARLTLDWKKILLALFLLAVQFVLYYHSGMWSYLLRCLLAAVLLFRERKLLLSLVRR